MSYPIFPDGRRRDSQHIRSTTGGDAWFYEERTGYIWSTFGVHEFKLPIKTLEASIRRIKAARKKNEPIQAPSL